MKKKNGFTLIELLVTIAILAGIVLIAVPVYNTVQKNQKDNMYNSKIEQIELAAENWAGKVNLNEPVQISVNKLVVDGFLTADKEDGKVLNPKDNTEMNCATVHISIEKSTAIAKFNGERNCDLVEEEIDLAKITITAKVLGTNNEINIQDPVNNVLEWTNQDVELSVTSEYENVTNISWHQSGNQLETTDDKLEVKAALFLDAKFSVSLTIGTDVRTKSVRVKIDKERPIINQLSISQEWANVSNKDITVKGTDGEGSGLAQYFVSSSETLPTNPSWSNFSASNIENNGDINLTINKSKGTYYIWLKDKVGNISEVKNFNIEKIDTTTPVIGNFTTTSSTTGTNGWYTALTRSTTITDSESGIAKVEYCLTTSTTCTPTANYPINTATSSQTINVPFTSNKNPQYLCVRTTDMAGNASQVKCDTSFKVDATGPTNVSATFSSTIKVINIGATDAESGISKYICEYGTTSTNLNLSVNAVGTTCTLTNIESGVTYYVRVKAYNSAGLVTNSSTTNGSWSYTIDEAYTESCGSNSYCPTPIYVKFRNTRNASYNMFVVFSKGTGYKAVLNGVYSQTEYAQTVCCDNGTCTYEATKFTGSTIGNILNNSFLSTLPTNYSTYINFASWDASYADSLRSRMVTSYIGLINSEEWSRMQTNTIFNEGTNNKPYWLSNLVRNYCNYGTAHFCGSTTAVGVLVAKYNNGAASTLYLLPNAAAAEQYSYAGMDVFARPVIEIKSGIKFTSGNGTKANPYVIG